ncbi:hypothetical protein [Rhizobium sp. MHM7A]|uniref:hypothetical protein n=1 Tax=Rhizobium sp. MHM7A TaxID=2583233 RepID=UPI001105B774|nr:hypothetical protein [Rhizobium sp. MHM7A]TLX17166.1 hypothetical protein FFR93_07605 [Rhizobium sp. MHM7A]
MLNKVVALYLEKFGKNGAYLHGAAIVSALFVDLSFALGLLVTSRRSAAIAAPFALAWATWVWFIARPFSEFTTYPENELFTTTSPYLIAPIAFSAGILFRLLVDGKFSRNAAVVAGIIALVLMTQGRGGLDEINARAVAYAGPALTRLDLSMKSLGHVSEIRQLKGMRSPEAIGAAYVWQRENWKLMSMTGVSDYNSYLVYLQQKQDDHDLLKTMSAMGKAEDWHKIMETRYNDPKWPDYMAEH